MHTATEHVGSTLASTHPFTKLTPTRPRLRRRGARLVALALALLVPLASHAVERPHLDSSADEVRAYVEESMATLERLYFRVGGETLEALDFDFDPESQALIVLFESQTLLLESRRSGTPNGKAVYFPQWSALSSEEPPENTPVLTGKLRRSRLGGDIRLVGDLEAEGEAVSPLAVDIRLNETLIEAGTSRFELDGKRALLTGALGTRTFAQLDALIREHPELETIVFQDVPGSVNDEINVHTGRLLRNAGLATFLPADGMAASGGVDLFAAGVKRHAEEGARVGIHAWCCYRGRGAQEIRRGHRAHAHMEAYFRVMLGEAGVDFYYQTLEAAPPEGIHWMTREELEASGLLTD